MLSLNETRGQNPVIQEASHSLASRKLLPPQATRDQLANDPNGTPKDLDDLFNVPIKMGHLPQLPEGSVPMSWLPYRDSV